MINTVADITLRCGRLKREKFGKQATQAANMTFTTASLKNNMILLNIKCVIRLEFYHTILSNMRQELIVNRFQVRYKIFVGNIDKVL